MTALETDDSVRASVEFCDVTTSGFEVERVDVLRDEPVDSPSGLPVGERLVSGVGTVEPEFGPADEIARPIPPTMTSRFHKVLILNRAVRAPGVQTDSLRSIVGNAAFGADSRSGHDEKASRGREKIDETVYRIRSRGRVRGDEQVRCGRERGRRYGRRRERRNIRRHVSRYINCCATMAT